MFTWTVKPSRMIGDLDNQRPDMWSSSVPGNVSSWSTYQWRCSSYFVFNTTYPIKRNVQQYVNLLHTYKSSAGLAGARLLSA
jgi:hypothetical protein